MVRAPGSILQESIQTRASVREIANLIGTETVLYNDPNLINTEYEKLATADSEAGGAKIPRPVVITVPYIGFAVSHPAAQ